MEVKRESERPFRDRSHSGDAGRTRDPSQASFKGGDPDTRPKSSNPGTERPNDRGGANVLNTSSGVPATMNEPERHSPQRAIPHILLVDDNAATTQMTVRWLRSKGYDVSFALDVENAIEILNNRAVDLVILDGDLGDGLYGDGSQSGNLVREHLEGRVRYVRFTGMPDDIPPHLHGEKCFTKGELSIGDWLQERIPASKLGA
ncbi:MAG: response regulator [Deltaproteobacteria bacterium]|nr:response regulator [Deltaproteobacteria bacterium]